MYASSEDAEEAFYLAFSNGDLDAMMQVWSPTGEIICIHPGGSRLAGIDAIRQSWEMLFRDSNMRRAFNLRGRIVVGSAELRMHQLEENIRLPGTHFIAPPVLATNVYQRQRHGWYMILHHAGVAPTALAAVSAAGTSGSAPPRLH